VFVHELGHFLAARLFGMRVDRFSIGFPPTIFKKKVGETEWVIGATPLGGYVKIAGMVDESMDTDFANEQPKPWEYRSKPVWQKSIVIGAGVLFNAIFAAVIFSVINMAAGETMPVATEDGQIYVSDSSIAAVDVGLRTGDYLLSINDTPVADARGLSLSDLDDAFLIRVLRDEEELLFSVSSDLVPRTAFSGDGGILGLGIFDWATTLGAVTESMPAYQAGLRVGDRITVVDGDSVALWQEFTSRVQASAGNAMQISWERPETGEALTAEIIPERGGEGAYRVGVQIAIVRERYDLISAVAVGVADTWHNAGLVLTSLGNIVAGRESVRESLGGPVMVARIAGEAAELGMEQFWRIVALLSITLAIVNILPIPVLDGGHMVFLVYEGILRREPPLRVRTAMQHFGMVLILLLMVFLIFNDLDRIFRFFQ